MNKLSALSALFCSIILLGFLTHSTLATTETRYFRYGDSVLGTTQTTTSSYIGSSGSGAQTVYWGIRVFDKSDLSEVTSGTPVAQVSRAASGSGIQSNTWACPATATDGVRVTVYSKVGSGSWVQLGIWETEDAVSLDSATWTVYYYTYRAYASGPDITTGRFYYGTSTYNSRIENFTWSEGGGAETTTLTLQQVASAFSEVTTTKNLKRSFQQLAESHQQLEARKNIRVTFQQLADSIGELAIIKSLGVTFQQLASTFGEFLSNAPQTVEVTFQQVASAISEFLQSTGEGAQSWPLFILLGCLFLIPLLLFFIIRRRG